MFVETLEESEWREQAHRHEKRVSAWTEPFRNRRAQGKLHPIYDFLFIYYRIKPSQLESWHPGFGIGLRSKKEETQFSERFYQRHHDVTYLCSQRMDDSTRHRLKMALRLCETVKERPPRFGCFGLHEWAMVYRGDAEGEIRHRESLPLRMSQDLLDEFVRSQPISCSHFDAFRFFSPTAKPFNRIQPGKETRIENEQCGCLHTNMDLYKLCGQCMPWIGSDLLWQSFEFAVSARQLDMQASPYDCTSLGFEPVKIETTSGRADYEKRQRAITEAAIPLRDELIRRLKSLDL